MVMRLSEEEISHLAEIRQKPYMIPPLELLDEFLQSSTKSRRQALREAFDHAHNFMVDAKGKIFAMQEKRLRGGKIKDTKQANKAIVGRMFPSLLMVLFLENKEAGNIGENIFVTGKTKAMRKFGKDFTVRVGKETQKPDCDLVIYNAKNKKTMILSLKTSLRERAGQTYKWKLLLEIAASKHNELKEKYSLSYEGGVMPLVCFATVNFYNEINKPQQRGMMLFFDRAFIAKPGASSGHVHQMSEIIDFIREKLG